MATIARTFNATASPKAQSIVFERRTKGIDPSIDQGIVPHFYNMPVPTSTSTRHPLTLLKALTSSGTAILADTLDFESLSVHDLHGMTLTPTSACLGLRSSSPIQYHLWVAVKKSLDTSEAIAGGGNNRRTAIVFARSFDFQQLVRDAVNRFVIELGKAIMDRVSGPYITFVDTRDHDNTRALVASAVRLVNILKEEGIKESKVVVSIPATEAGIEAANILASQHRIRTNLTLVCGGEAHARACADAGASVMTIPVGPTLNWYEENTHNFDLANHPGRTAIQGAVTNLKLHGITTKIVGTEFRALTEISMLGSGMDAISIDEDQMKALRWSCLQLAPPTVPEPASRPMKMQNVPNPMEMIRTKLGFMASMSAEARSAVAGTMYFTLGKWKVQMEEIEDAVKCELLRQYGLKTLNLEQLYSSNKVQERERQPENVEKERIPEYIPEIPDEDAEFDLVGVI